MSQCPWCRTTSRRAPAMALRGAGATVWSYCVGRWQLCRADVGSVGDEPVKRNTPFECVATQRLTITNVIEVWQPGVFCFRVAPTATTGPCRSRLWGVCLSLAGCPRLLAAAVRRVQPVSGGLHGACGGGERPVRGVATPGFLLRRHRDHQRRQLRQQGAKVDIVAVFVTLD